MGYSLLGTDLRLNLTQRLEALTIYAHYRAHRAEGVLVDAAGDFQDACSVTLAAYHHRNLAFVLGVPALAVDDGHATTCLEVDGVGYGLILGRNDKYLARLLVTRLNQIDRIAIHSNHNITVDNGCNTRSDVRCYED